MVWIGLILLRIRTGGGLLWTRWWTFGFDKMLGSSWVAAQVAASQEGLSSMSDLQKWFLLWCYYILSCCRGVVFSCAANIQNLLFMEERTSMKRNTSLLKSVPSYEKTFCDVGSVASACRVAIHEIRIQIRKEGFGTHVCCKLAASFHLNIVACWSTARQRLGKHVPATTNTQATIG
jgi:hypothetical protein